MSDCPASIREQIERDIRAEARGRDAADIYIPRRVAAGLRREAIYASRPQRPICPAPGAGLPPDTEGEASDGFDWYHGAQADYQAVCENQTGRPIADSAFAEARKRQTEKDEQSVELANALDSTGRFPFRFNFGEDWAGRCTVYDPFTGAVLPLPPLRRVVFMPSFAAMLRSKLLRDAEHFLSCYVAGECRMFTMTHGERVVFDSPEQFRAECQKHSRRISKLNTMEPFRRYLVPRKHRKRLGRRAWAQQVQIELRGMEFGSPEFHGGKLTLHIHSHLIVREVRPMTGKQRANFRRRMWQRWGKVWDDAGTIQNPREFVKYPVKPGDLETIRREGGPGLLADFYQAVKGLHLFQPMGELKHVRRKRREKARRITAFSRQDGRVLEETGDWNAGKRPLTAPNKHRAKWRESVYALRSKLATAEFVRLVGGGTVGELPVCRGPIGDPSPETTRLPEETEEDGNAHVSDARGPGPRIANRIIARLAPACYGGPILTPAVVVWGFDGNVEALRNQPVVARMLEQHLPAYIRARDARELTLACAHAPAPAASEGSQWSSNCPRADAQPDDWRTSDLLAWAEN